MSDRIYCSLHRLDRAGYDENGRYYGVPRDNKRLYVAYTGDGRAHRFLRAISRADAIEQFAEHFDAHNNYRK